MQTNKDIHVQVDGGRQIRLGSEAEFKLASREITQYTGGSSLGGSMSMLWGILDGEQMQVSAATAKQIAAEAVDFKRLLGMNLSQRANELLSAIASISTKAPAVENSAKIKRKL
jgi:predicted alpha/beta-fold hydrolase